MPIHHSEVPKGAPKYNINRLRRIADRAYGSMVDRNFYGTLRGRTCDLVEKHLLMLCGSVPREDEDLRENRKKAIHSLVAPFYGKELSGEAMRIISLRMAGWETELSEGILFEEWDPLGEPSWACLFIKDIERILTRGRMYRCLVESRGGDTTGAMWDMRLPGTFLQMLIRDAGAAKYEKYDDMDASGIWFTAKLFYEGSRLRLSEPFASNSQKVYNRKLQKERKEKCLYAEEIYPAEHTNPVCFNCWMGIDQCPRARHIACYEEKGDCNNGHLGRMVKKGYCLACINNGHFSVPNRRG